MPLPRSTIFALLTFACALLPAAPALAGYGAIAWDRDTGKRGWSWNQPTAQKAGEVAISECGASGCKVIIRTRSAQCAALATTEDGKFAGAAGRKTKDAARDAALAELPEGQSRRLHPADQRLQQVKPLPPGCEVRASLISLAPLAGRGPG